MKVYELSAPLVNEPKITGPERTFLYAGNFFVMLDGSINDPSATEVDWHTDDEVKQELVKYLSKANLDEVEKQAYDLVTAPTATELHSAHIAGVRSEVARRILAHASQGTQMNMAAAAAAGMFGEAELKAFQAGLQWVGLVRQKGQELVINGVSDYTSDEHWPVAPEAAAELAKRF